MVGVGDHQAAAHLAAGGEFLEGVFGAGADGHGVDASGDAGVAQVFLGGLGLGVTVAGQFAAEWVQHHLGETGGDVDGVVQAAAQLGGGAAVVLCGA